MTHTETYNCIFRGCAEHDYNVKRKPTKGKTTMAAKTRVKLKSPTLRMTYAYIWEPDDHNKYKFTGIHDPKTTNEADKAKMKAIYELVDQVKKENFPEYDSISIADYIKGNRPSGFALPFRRGGEIGVDWLAKPEFAGKIVMTLQSAAQQPPACDRAGVELDPENPKDRAKIYSGCYVSATLTVFSYNKNGKKGVGLGLQSLMKLKDGEPLGNTRKASNDFKDVDVDAEYGADNSSEFSDDEDYGV